MVDKENKKELIKRLWKSVGRGKYLTINEVKEFKFEMKYELKPYKVIIKVKVEKFISKLDKKLQIRSIKEIEKLAENPVPRNKNHILATKGNAFLCELGIDKIRFYYEVKHGIIYIEDVKYLGLVEVLDGSSNHKSGNSKNYPNQQKFIKKLSKWFFSKFKR